MAFIHYDGTDRLIAEEGPEEAARQLDVLVTHVQGAADRQGVTFLATDADKDGGKIILTAGAPSSSGDDEHRMLLAVREIMDADNPLPIRIGVNQGSVFVGEVGPHYRRTFTVMGDAVNLAARLMAKAAPGEIYTTPDLLARSQTGFAATELEPFFVKGKAKPVRAVRLGAKTRDVTGGGDDELPFVGRGPELAELEEIASVAAAARWWRSSARPGVGKSRLAGRLREVTDRPDAAVRGVRALRLDDPLLHGAAAAPRPARSAGRRERRRAARPRSWPSWSDGRRSSSRGLRSSAWRSRSPCPRPARPWSSKRSSGGRSWPRRSLPCWPCCSLSRG